MAKGNKAEEDYSSKSFLSLSLAYSAYVRRRYRETENPAVAPKAEFAQIWGWKKTSPKGEALKEVLR